MTQDSKDSGSLSSAANAAASQIRHPDPNANKTEKTAAPLATLSSEADPYPHIFMSAATGFGSGYAYYSLKQPRLAAISAAVAAAYAYGAYLIDNRQYKRGYTVSSIASLGLLAACGPTAYVVKDPFNVSFASLGAISTAANTLKAYQQWTGRPRELHRAY
ncbi:1023_t:CDS:2 [Paraglomus occultum]|uniref:1023_t:CDS:1 n=1 Tax=Paraglomus occultum TaxID=144539 RepID=A0A9N9GL66_9GLOM|nr:1023_t:CDS:2 [Paraglomus occultum]